MTIAARTALIPIKQILIEEVGVEAALRIAARLKTISRHTDFQSSVEKLIQLLKEKDTPITPSHTLKF